MVTIVRVGVGTSEAMTGLWRSLRAIDRTISGDEFDIDCATSEKTYSKLH
jgi:hypothetical protein